MNKKHDTFNVNVGVRLGKMGEWAKMTTIPKSVCSGINELDKISCKLDAVLSSMADGFFIIAADWKVTYANKVVLSHPTAGDIVGRNILYQYSRVRPLLNGLLKARKYHIPARCEAFVDFAGIWLELNIHPLPEAELAVYARDVTQEKQNQIALQEKFQSAFNSGSVLMTISTIEDGRYLAVNDCFLETLGYSRQEVLGKTSQELGLFANYEDRTRLYELFKSLGRIVNFSIDVRDRAGELHAGLFSVEMIRSQDEPCWLASLIDITREKRLQDTLEAANLALQRKADVDGLTGIYNHAYLMNSLEKEIDRAKRYGTALSIVMIDIDNFKSFNDTHGHLVGDQVLKNVAEYMKESLRGIDVMGRYGGEEFMLVLPSINQRGALDVAERIRLGIASSGFASKELHISVSAGVAEFNGQTKDALIQAADYNMYIAKRKGKNRVEG